MQAIKEIMCLLFQTLVQVLKDLITAHTMVMTSAVEET